MTWYIIKTINLKNFSKFCKKVFKKYKLWIPPEDIYKYTVFLSTEEQIPENDVYCFIKLTNSSYEQLVNSDSENIKIEDDNNLKIGRKVKIVSTFLSFDAKVIKISKKTIKVKALINNKDMVLTVPVQYIR